MFDKAYSTLILLVHVFSLYGWGELVTRRLHGRGSGRLAYSTAMGVATWILLTGLLSSMRMIAQWSLLAIVFSGLLMTAHLVLSRRGRCADSEPAANVQGFVVVVAGLVPALFMLTALVPTTAFNYGDDFLFYLTRPVRALATGSAVGAPFECLGFDPNVLTFSAQSCLHSFFLVWLTPAHLNILDAVLCLGLGTALLVEMGGWLKAPLVLRFASPLLFVAINPQCVNISALYSGSLMVLGLAGATQLCIDSMVKRPTKDNVTTQS